MSLDRMPHHIEAAKEAAAALDADVFVYNGPIAMRYDLEFINVVSGNCSRPRAVLLLATNGGDPDAAYKMTRYIQERYDEFTVLIAGKCKSAGTLIAVGASELAFMPYGELGPLDIQLTKIDRFDQAQSGLTIQDALNTLEDRATDSFYKIVNTYIAANQGLLSFPVAAKAASDYVTALYAPMFGRIDPEEVGARARSMRIADDYGKRLAAKWRNVKEGAVQKLAETYSSHSFVIDQREAAGLFNNVRRASEAEMRLVEASTAVARFQTGSECVTYALSEVLSAEGDVNDLPADGGAPPDGGDPQGAGGTEDPPAVAAAGGLRVVTPS